MTPAKVQVLRARRAPPLPSTGRVNERVLCGKAECGNQIGWIERGGADRDFYHTKDAYYWNGPLPYRKGIRVFSYDGAPIARPEEYDYVAFRVGYACIDSVWKLTPEARAKAAKRRIAMDRFESGDRGRIDASLTTPNELPAWVECPACQKKQVLYPRALAVNVLKLQSDL